jgi:hypothetical protein
MINITPIDDGKTHINTYSQGRTVLGRQLTNFADSPFNHPKHGYFRSLEAFYYYLGSGCQFEGIRDLHGNEAKQYGRMVCQNNKIKISMDENFKDDFIIAIQCKLRENRDILFNLISTDLPLTHYLISKGKIQNKARYRWMLDEVNRIRTLTQGWYINKYGALPKNEILYYKK